jgi:hypothetical protein
MTPRTVSPGSSISAHSVVAYNHLSQHNVDRERLCDPEMGAGCVPHCLDAHVAGRNHVGQVTRHPQAVMGMMSHQIHIRPQHGPLCSQKRLIWTHPQITGDGVYKIA